MTVKVKQAADQTCKNNRRPSKYGAHVNISPSQGAKPQRLQNFWDLLHART